MLKVVRGRVNYIAALYQLPRWLVAALIWFFSALIVLSFGGLLMLEAYLFATRQPPISLYIRSFTTYHVVVGIIIGMSLVVGAVGAFFHFIVDR